MSVDLDRVVCYDKKPNAEFISQSVYQKRNIWLKRSSTLFLWIKWGVDIFYPHNSLICFHIICVYVFQGIGKLKWILEDPF